MTDWCACGNKASVLCLVCKTPTCPGLSTGSFLQGVSSGHHELRRDVLVGQGVSLDLNVTTNGVPICPVCLPGFAGQEFENVVHPVLQLNCDTRFEAACAAIYSREKAWGGGPSNLYGLQDILNRTQLPPKLFWTVTKWSGRFIDGLSRSEFSQEFASAARNRGFEPTPLRVGRAKVDAYFIYTVGEERGDRVAVFVAADGSTLYDPDLRQSKWTGKWESVGIPNSDAASATIQIPVGAACALGLGIPN